MSKQDDSLRVGFWMSAAVLSVIALVAIVGRVMTEGLPNVAPIAAAAMLAGHVVGRRFGRPILAALVPMLAMLISDFLWFGSDTLGVMLTVYGAFLVSVLMGRMIGKVNWWRVGGMSLAGSLLFFFATNAAVWLFTPYYPTTAAGLMASLAAGVPFLKNTVLGDLFFAGVLFGGYALVCVSLRSLAGAKRLSLAH